MRETVTAKELARVLNEPCPWLLSRCLRTLGEARCVEIVIEALTIESNGGMLTHAGDRRRTPGVVFLQVVRERSTAEERAVIFRRAGRRA